MDGMEKTMSGEQDGVSLAAALLDDPCMCVWREWDEGKRLVILNRAERLGEEQAGHYLLVERGAILQLKEIIPVYADVVQFLEHAGVDPYAGWHVSTEEATNLPERVRRAVFALYNAPAFPVG